MKEISWISCLVVIIKRKVVFEDTLRTQYVEKVHSMVVQIQDRMSVSFSVDGRLLVDQQDVDYFS